jgi:hypothetical protein
MILNRNTLDFGIYVDIAIRQGQWSDMSLDKVKTEELG